MFKPVRIVASVIFLASIGLVFVAAFVLSNGVSPIYRGIRTNLNMLLSGSFHK